MVSPSPSLSQDPGRPRGQWRVCPEPCGPGSGADRCHAALSLTLPLAGGRGWWGAGVLQELAGSEGEASGLRREADVQPPWWKMCLPLLFLFLTPPSSRALWCERSHRAPPGTVAAPFGVSRSQLTMEKTAPSLPALYFCCQKYFYSNIHLFTTWDLRGFCFLFGVFFLFFFSPKDAF